MKASTHIRFLSATLLVALALTSCSRKAENPHNIILLRAESDALQAKILLTELRAGRLTNALELLENKMDGSIITIDHSLSKITASERRDPAFGVLRSLKEYRRTHPRHQEAIMPDIEYGDMTQKASRILSEVK